MRLVDAVDENEVRNAKLVELPERRRSQRSARRVRIDDDDGDIRHRHAARGIGCKADRSGGIDDGVFLAEIGEIVEVGFGRTASGARFFAAVADAALVGRRPLAVGGSAGIEKCFRQRCLARAGRSDQRD